ncbi:MAG TPA: NAD(P)H-hydrate dehydratase, partial [Terriglobales bacterium]|nr:NAD(P)H-hydrate dehydratase [Terriglobales bacterium]
CFVLSDYPQAERVGILCGKGNNGGDGFVVARKLIEAGRAVRVLLLSDPADLRGDAATMFQNMLQRLQSLNIAPLIVREESRLDSAEAAEIFAADVIVDAILGTGFRPPVSPWYAAAIDRMNAASAPIVAVDIPSGADADAMQPRTATGSSDGIHTQARADAVVTFTAPRPAHIFAAFTSGPTVIAPIGSPPEAIVTELGLYLSTPSDFAPLLVPRARDANKGSYGHVLVIGGSLGKAGAAAMAGFSALRAGAGLATVATPKSVLATVAAFHPELMTEPLAETNQGTISLRALESSAALDALLERKTLAIGPGISRNSETAEFVREILKRTADDTPIVVDADALNAFEGRADLLNGRGRTVVITPHPGEMARLTGLSILEIQADRLQVARKFARQHELIVVLKGYRTLIAAPTAAYDGAVWVNPTGNPGLATGGTGDILTGMVASLIAQHPQHALAATALAVYLHGLAGDLANESVGENCMVATDLVRFLPHAFAEMRNQKSNEIRLHS